MEAPTPFNEPRVKKSESLLFTFNSTFKNDNFIFNLYDISNSKIKISANKNTNDIMFSRYESEIYLDELKKRINILKCLIIMKNLKIILWIYAKQIMLIL